MCDVCTKNVSFQIKSVRKKHKKEHPNIYGEKEIQRKQKLNISGIREEAKVIGCSCFGFAFFVEFILFFSYLLLW